LRSDDVPAESIYDYQALVSFGVEAGPQAMFDSLQNLPDDLWNMPKKGSLQDWLDNAAENSALPTATAPLQNSASTTIPNLSDCAQPYNASSTTSPRNSFPALFYDNSTYNLLEDPFFDVDIGRQ
jgi:hypothetical protein